MVHVGVLIDGRFRITEVAGQGGFGTVFRAIDATSARDVAVKVFAREQTDFARFEREAEVLATVRHRHVVAYVGHGLTDEGAPYLAMEWLEGMDLAVRLNAGPLSFADSLTLALRAAQGIAAVHQHGIVHRDVKPSNLFLLGGRPDEVRLIDFGIARAPESFAKLTATGTVLGTPSYMAPEQARGVREVTPRVDVFALGAVLFECLTGVPAFDGPTAHAILAKVLSGVRPRASDLRPELPAMVDLLLARMLAHDPAERLADGAAAASAISGLLSDGTQAAQALTAAAVSDRPLRAQSSVLARAAAGREIPDRALRVAAELDADVSLQPGTLVASFALDAPREAARRAAQYALKLREIDRSLAIAIVTLRHETLAANAQVFETQLDFSEHAGTPGEILVDAVSARYLGGEYEITRTGPHTQLVGRRGTPSRAVQAFVGRARELAVLAGTLAAVVEELSARILLVTGETGIGKSRLLEEFLARAARSSEAPRVLRARGDRPTSTSPFAIAGELVRNELVAGAAVDDARRYLHQALLARGLAEVDAAFACELAGLRAAGDEAPQLAAARRDPLIMADAYRSAWLGFLQAQLEAGPTLIVIEDLHLVDPPSMHLLDVALEQFAERSLLVVCTASAEEAVNVSTLFEKRRPESVALPPLRPHLARELARSLLPEEKSETLDEIVRRGAGNPLALGELARLSQTAAIAADSLLGAVEARLQRVDPSVRRVLRAASVFGIQFPLSGVAALLGGDDRDEAVLRALQAAARERFVSAVTGSARAGTWAFANALIQEATYDTLPLDERRAAHAAVGRFLGQRAAEDPSLVAWHFERADAREHALRYYVAAARAALEGRELDRALALADRALACHPSGRELSRVLVLRAEAAFVRSDITEGKRSAASAMAAATAGSLEWLMGAGLLVSSAGQLGDNTELIGYAEQVRAAGPEPGAAGVRAVCLCRAASQLYALGEYAVARDLALEAERSAEQDLLARAWVSRLRAGFLLLEDAYEPGLEAYATAVQLHTAAGDVRGACQARILKASFHIFAADFENGEAELEVAEGIARRTGADYFALWASYARGKILALTEEPSKAREHMEFVRKQLATSPRIVAGTHVYLGLAALRAGDYAWAEDEAHAGLLAHAAPSTRAQALGVLARALAGRARPEEALQAAEQASEILRTVGRVEENESVVHLALVEALLASGREAQARLAAETAASRLLRIASGLRTPARRESFLERVEAHAKTLRLAQKLGIPIAGY